MTLTGSFCMSCFLQSLSIWPLACVGKSCVVTMMPEHFGSRVKDPRIKLFNNSVFGDCWTSTPYPLTDTFAKVDERGAETAENMSQNTDCIIDHHFTLYRDTKSPQCTTVHHSTLHQTSLHFTSSQITKYKATYS